MEVLFITIVTIMVVLIVLMVSSVITSHKSFNSISAGDWIVVPTTNRDKERLVTHVCRTNSGSVKYIVSNSEIIRFEDYWYRSMSVISKAHDDIVDILVPSEWIKYSPVDGIVCYRNNIDGRIHMYHIAPGYKPDDRWNIHYVSLCQDQEGCGVPTFVHTLGKFSSDDVWPENGYITVHGVDYKFNA